MTVEGSDRVDMVVVEEVLQEVLTSQVMWVVLGSRQGRGYTHVRTRGGQTGATTLGLSVTPDQRHNPDEWSQGREVWTLGLPSFRTEEGPPGEEEVWTSSFSRSLPVPVLRTGETHHGRRRPTFLGLVDPVLL